MPTQVSYPGVYIEEIPSGVRSISGVSTSTTVFIGLSSYEKDNNLNTEHKPIPRKLSSYSDYQREFGPPHLQSNLALSVRLFFLNGGLECYVVNILDGATAATATIRKKKTDIMEFKAKLRGRECNHISVEIVDSNNQGKNFTVLVRYDNIVKECFTLCSMDTTNENFVEKKLLDSDYVSCNVYKSTLPSSGTFSLSGAIDTQLPNYSELVTHYKEAIKSLDAIDIFNLLVITKTESNPELQQGMRDSDYSEILTEASEYCKKRRAFLLVDPLGSWLEWEAPINDSEQNISTLRTKVTPENSAVYFPRLKVTEYDPVNKKSVTKKIGPAAAMAGIISKVDSEQGVWKAPAGINTKVKGIIGIDVPITEKTISILNQEAINCIRSFAIGTVVWGARTMAGYVNGDWKFVPVRRLALFIEESIDRMTKWVVFEPNDEPTWAGVRTSVGAFMRDLFNKGAFQGASTKEAFFVKCDKDTTTEYHRKLGLLNIIVGFAPLKPAEFVIIQIQQMSELS